jgi:hypothetical protein
MPRTLMLEPGVMDCIVDWSCCRACASGVGAGVGIGVGVGVGIGVAVGLGVGVDVLLGYGVGVPQYPQIVPGVGAGSGEWLAAAGDVLPIAAATSTSAKAFIELLIVGPLSVYVIKSRWLRGR